MDMNFSVFQEPRGVMRILQFVFAICAFPTAVNYTGFIAFQCDGAATIYKYLFEYPYNLQLQQKEMNLGLTNVTCHPRATILSDFSSDAKFFVATGVIAMLYSIIIIIVYTKFDQLYKTNSQIPLVDFLLSVFIAVLWLSSSASWSNALNGMKTVTEHDNIQWNNVSDGCGCKTYTSSFSSLNISVILGFLNFFLWAADLWFLYKETIWFQNARVANPEEN